MVVLVGIDGDSDNSVVGHAGMCPRLALIADVDIAIEVFAFVELDNAITALGLKSQLFGINLGYRLVFALFNPEAEIIIRPSAGTIAPYTYE